MTEIIDLPNKQLFTPTEIAKHFNVSPQTIYKSIGNKSLPAVRIGKKLLRVKREEVLKFVTDCDYDI